MREYFIFFLHAVANGAGLTPLGSVCGNASFNYPAASPETDLNLQLYGQAGVFSGTNYPLTPDDWSSKIPSHLPVVQLFLAPFARITVPHEMIETHWITSVWADDQDDNLIECSEFNFSTTKSIKDPNWNMRIGIEFFVPSHVSVLKAFEDCNAHGTWAASHQNIPSNMCDKQTELLAENMQLHNVNGVFHSSTVTNTNYPGGWASKVGSHVPNVTMFLSWRVRVVVPHEMVDTHWITAVWLKDHRGNDLPGTITADSQKCLDFSAGNTTIAMVEYNIPRDFDTGLKIVGYEHCNKHGVWKSNAKTVPTDFCNGQKYEGFVAENYELWATPGFFTSYNYPTGWQPKTGSHVPVISPPTGTNGLWHVVVPHENTNTHWITTIWVMDQDGGLVICADFTTQTLNTNQPGEASIEFSIAPGVTSLFAYEHCNLHGTWKSIEYFVPCVDTNMLLHNNNPQGVPHTASNPGNGFDDLKIAHLPYFPPTYAFGEPLFLAPKARIIVPHDQMLPSHHITSIWAEDQNGTVIACKTFDGLQPCTMKTADCTEIIDALGLPIFVPYLDFYVPRTALQVTAWEHCNLHEVWKGAEMTMDYTFCTTDKIEQLKQENIDLHNYTNGSAIFGVDQFPMGWAGKTRSHVPQIEVFLAPMVRITVPHEMIATHWITSVWLTAEPANANGFQICNEFDLSDKPVFDFYLTAGTISVKAWEHCNKHGVWESQPVQIPSGMEMCSQTSALIQENYQLYNTPGPFYYDYFPTPPLFPVDWSGKKLSHVPAITMIGTKHRITVPHEMTATHWITAIWVLNERNETLICEDFTPGMITAGNKGLDANGHPYVEITIPDSTTGIYAFEHCNKHGVWQSCFNEAQMISRNKDLSIANGISSDPGYGKAMVFSKSIVPKNWDDMRASHIPMVRMVYAPAALIEINHVMAVDHKITALWAFDQDGGKLICEVLNRTAYDPFGPIKYTYFLPMGTTSLTVYENCDIHGVWKSDSVSVPPTLLCPNPVSNTGISNGALVDANFELYKIRGAFTDLSFPPDWSGKISSHVPKLSTFIDGLGTEMVVVEVTHEMTRRHWITAIWVEDADGNVIHCKDFTFIQKGNPRTEFALPNGISFNSLTAYEHCNKHGVWLGEAIGSATTPPSNAALSLRKSIKFPLMGVIFGIFGIYLM